MTYKHFAAEYYKLGFNTTCISYLKTPYNSQEKNPEKSPSHEWIELQIKKQSIEEINGYAWEYSVGVGCILGYNKTVCIDIDDCSDYSLIKDILKVLRLPDDYEWAIKTPKGFHIFIQSENLNLPCGINNKGIICLTPNENHVDKYSRIEFRYAGHVILPPSNINRKYSFIQDIEIPAESPKNVKSITVFRLMAYLAGNYGPYNTSPSSYVAKLKIDELDFYFTENSDFSEFILSKKNNILFEQCKYSIDNAIDIKKYNSIIYLDIETTGLIKDPTNYKDYPRPIQISYLEEKSNGELKETNYFIKHSDLKLSDDILRLTGLTSEFLQQNGHDLQEVLNLLYNKFNNRQLIVMHNSDFDTSIFDSEYLKINKRNPLRDVQSYCTMKSFADENKSKFPKLSELYESLFHKPVSLKMHNSLNDVYVLRDCYKLMDLYGYTNSFT